MVKILNRMYYMYYCTCLRDVTPAAAFQEVDPPLQKSLFFKHLAEYLSVALYSTIESKTPKLRPVLCHDIPPLVLYTTVQYNVLL